MKKYIAAVCFFFLTLLLGAMAAQSDGDVLDYTYYLQRHDASAGDAERMESLCRQAAELCQALLLGGDREASPYAPYDTTLTQSAVDSIEALLAAEGLPVVDSDREYPSCLANADGAADFFQAAENKETARQDVIYVSRYGMLDIYTLCCEDGRRFCVRGAVRLDDAGGIVIEKPREYPVLDWGLTYNGYLYFQLQPLNNHSEAYSSVRIYPADPALYDLGAKYIYPVGYAGNNLFLLDWDSSRYGYMCFNDLLEPLYRLRYDRPLDTSALAFDEDLPGFGVPADEFESVILPFFDISPEDLKAAALYDGGSDAYPWQKMNSANLSFFPPVTPDVTDCRHNDDGTVTVTVDVLCFDLQAFPLFTHEVTVRPHDDGSFQYLANTVTYKSGLGFPNTAPRLPALRPSDMP